jgi:hypothetical protein
MFEFFEGTVLGDGRVWVLGGEEGEGPGLADVEGIISSSCSLVWFVR